MITHITYQFSLLQTQRLNYNSRSAINIKQGSAPKCPITGKVPNVLFRCEVNSIDAIKQLFGDNYDDNSTPAILKTWDQFINEYEGNSILDMIDPVDLLKHPINTANRYSSYSPFIFSIAFSKSGYIQYCKDQNITLNRFWQKKR